MDGETSDTVTVRALTAKEIKKIAKPEFAANPDKFYPTATLKRLGFSRAHCGCGNNYWRASEARQTCGDSQCEKKYSFIGVGTGIGRGPNGKKLSYAEAWNGFSRSLSSARIPCTPIKRYPVVARWRADVDYVAAGIFCFQPYAVSGELEPPANPLICPQFCLRFNDLDNIGITGRHYSGFIMLGIQVFNKPHDRKFWMEECVEFNFRWLTEELGIDKEEITFIEDVWAGGGNLGPSIEYFVGGLELGNMVFMQYKTFPDGTREPLQVQVIDVGIGLERVPWLINGSPTSYVDVFPSALAFLQGKVGQEMESDVWTKFGPLSCLLNVDEVEDLDHIWSYIGEQIGLEGKAVKAAIEPVRDLYKILDHTRSVLMAVYDGSLPSNVGGAANVRNILRNVFSLLKKRGWWEKLGMEGLLQLFEEHKKDLSAIYGDFEAYKSFNPIIELEFKRWQTTDDEQKATLSRLLKKRKAGEKLSIDQWIQCVTAHGIPAETVALLSGEEVPGNLWYAIAEQQERTVKVAPAVLYQTAHLPETRLLYLEGYKRWDFEGEILEVLANVQDHFSSSVVVLDRSGFYPTSGGQEHDVGQLTIDAQVYQVVDVIRVGPAVLHLISPPLPLAKEDYKGKQISGLVDQERRVQLRSHHTATHIVFASCRRVLGPHVWQNGAKKTVQQAHLDITHYASLNEQQLMDIQEEANKIIQQNKPVHKSHMAKDEAEKKYGFHLYQGGIVPGNELRIVSIEETDTEACCGDHVDSTGEVGFIKILKASRISDGIVRLYFVAGRLALSKLREEAEILRQLTSVFSVLPEQLVATSERFFQESKKFSSLAASLTLQNLQLTVENLLLTANAQKKVLKSNEETATIFIANMPQYAEKLKEGQKGVVFVGDKWIFGLFGSAALFDVKKLEAFIPEQLALDEKKREEQAEKEKKLGLNKAKAAPSSAANAKLVVQAKDTVSITKLEGKKKVAVKVSGISQFVIFNTLGVAQNTLIDFFKGEGFTD